MVEFLRTLIDLWWISEKNSVSHGGPATVPARFYLAKIYLTGACGLLPQKSIRAFILVHGSCTFSIPKM